MARRVYRTSAYGLPPRIGGLTRARSGGRTMGPRAAKREACSMSLPPNTQQRDLVRLAVLLCGDRPSEKYRSPAKGAHNSSNADPSRGYAR